MGQQMCNANKLIQASSLNGHKDESQIVIDEDGDNPSKKKLSNKFLKTEVVASWNILQEKNLNHERILMNDSQKTEAENKNMPTQIDGIKQNNQNQSGNNISSFLVNALKQRRFFQQVSPAYQNLQIDVSNFIKIRTQNINEFYQFKEKVGQGTFGNVYRGIQKRNGEVTAIKALKKKSMNNASEMNFIAELDLLKTIDHPNIIKLYDLFLWDGNYYVVTEFCQGGCLQKYFLKKKGQISEETIRIIMKQLLSVLCYLNNQDIVHRDLKLQNIVFLKKSDQQSSDYEVKIIDFGTAVKVQKHKKNQSKLVGTLLYIAPEFSKGFFTEKCDIWSAGIILYLLIFNDFPFKGKNQKQILSQIDSKNIAWNQLKCSVSKEALTILKSMLDKNYLTRACTKNLILNEWIRGACMCRASQQISEKAATNFAHYNRKSNFVSVIQSFLCFKKISQQQRQQLSRMFLEIDNDNSGFIQVHELKQFFKKKFPEYKEQNIAEIVQNIDKNNSGKIDFNEFITAMSKKNDLFAESALKQAFDYIDTDNTGFITKKQIQKLLKLAQKKEIEELFVYLDQNGDNQISFDEFKTYLLNS